MKDLKHISFDNKEKLVGLINKTASFVNNGMDPTDALVKAASDGDYPPEYILRAAEAYNGAAHLAYFKSASLEERGNSFMLADGEAALNRIVNSVDPVNKVAEKVSFAFITEDTAFFETSTISDDVLHTEKQAAAPSFYLLQKQASSLDKQEKLNIEVLKNRYNEACESLASGIRSFQDKTASVSAHRKGHWAREMLERHGDDALPIISIATKVSSDECVKLSSDKIGYFSLGIQELDSLDSLVKCHNQTAYLYQKLAQAEHDHYVNNLERTQLLNAAAGVAVKRSGFSMPLTEPLEEKFTDMVLGGGDSETAQRGALESLLDPEFMDQVNRIDNALLVHKLIRSDPIIASHSPNEIEQSISEIYSLAPTAAKSEPLLRSMLLRRLELGPQIDDFSWNQMLSMEEKMRNARKEYTFVPKFTGLD